MGAGAGAGDRLGKARNTVPATKLTLCTLLSAVVPATMV